MKYLMAGGSLVASAGVAALALVLGCSASDPSGPSNEPIIDDAGTHPEDSGSTTPQDGDEGGDVGAVEAAGDCPEGVICIDQLPYTHTGTTQGAPLSAFQSYACMPSNDDSGPEQLYRVDILDEGLLAIGLTGVPAGVEVNVHLLSARDPSSCMIDGDARAASWVEPGRYWISVDTAQGVDKAGAYSIAMALTTPSKLAGDGMSEDVARTGLKALSVAWGRGDTQRFEYGMTDFSLHSKHPRLWIVDLSTGDLLWNLHVAHGEGSADSSDQGLSVTFSNTDGSHQSSLGMLRVAESYEGTYGHSARLDGLEPEYNDAVRSRDIVLHPWTGSEPAYVQAHGMVAVTFGCPGIDDKVAPTVVDRLTGGALLWFWYPDGEWSKKSTYLQ